MPDLRRSPLTSPLAGLSSPLSSPPYSRGTRQLPSASEEELPPPPAPQPPAQSALAQVLLLLLRWSLPEQLLHGC